MYTTVTTPCGCGNYKPLVFSKDGERDSNGKLYEQPLTICENCRRVTRKLVSAPTGK